MADSGEFSLVSRKFGGWSIPAFSVILDRIWSRSRLRVRVLRGSFALFCSFLLVAGFSGCDEDDSSKKKASTDADKEKLESKSKAGNDLKKPGGQDGRKEKAVKSKLEVPTSAEAVRALPVGAQVPAFVVEDANGATFDFSGALKAKASVVVFYRGGW